ncbi:unnamed protein product [Prunus armeniaca]
MVVALAVVDFAEHFESLRILDAVVMRSCQLGSSSICIRSSGSRCSTKIDCLNSVSSADPRLASAYACVFSTRGIYWIVQFGNAFKSF